jgi:hypothetical protein
MPIADFQTLVDKMVRAPDGVETIATTDRDTAIEAARLRYSADAERVLVVDVAWAAAGYLNALPAGWTEGSYLLEAEYPIGEQPASVIPMGIYMEPAAQKLVVEDALPAGALVRVKFTAPHLLNGGATPADTIPLVHREAVASYAAHLLCAQLAAHFSGQRETSVNADSAETESRSRNYATRAKEYRAAYYAGIGKADPRADKSGQAGAAGGEPAASAGAWSSRSRNSLLRGSIL